MLTTRISDEGNDILPEFVTVLSCHKIVLYGTEFRIGNEENYEYFHMPDIERGCNFTESILK